MASTKHFLRLFVIALGVLEASIVWAGSWEHIKDKHFIVFFNFKQDVVPASIVLRKAEECYNKIANQIGYSRYADFWTWEERVKIIIFPDQQTFMDQTGQPAWSKGYADRDSRLFHSRIIVTYRQEGDFLEGLLPHEIGHLILRDFVGFEKTIPLWFEEGVAQLQESNKKQLADQLMRSLVKKRQQIPVGLLMRWDVRQEGDSQKVTIFYLESVSIVDFLIKNYGSSNFGYLCRNLKDGKSMEEALRLTYFSAVGSLDELEKKWIEYMDRPMEGK